MPRSFDEILKDQNAGLLNYIIKNHDADKSFSTNLRNLHTANPALMEIALLQTQTQDFQGFTSIKGPKVSGYDTGEFSKDDSAVQPTKDMVKGMVAALNDKGVDAVLNNYANSGSVADKATTEYLASRHNAIVEAAKMGLGTASSKVVDKYAAQYAKTAAFNDKMAVLDAKQGDISAAKKFADRVKDNGSGNFAKKEDFKKEALVNANGIA